MGELINKLYCNCIVSLDRSSSYHRVFCMPCVKKFRVEPSNNNIRHIIFMLHYHLPRGLVVRIRRSHRRGPGSIPGVGIVSLFELLFLSFEGFAQSPRLCGNPHSLTSRKMKNVHFVIVVNQILTELSHMTFNL